jgi:two-component system response regulator HydG
MFEQELNNYWKAVVDTIHDGVMIVNTEGVIVSVNKAFESITGYSREEILGKPCSMLNCSACRVIRENNDGHYCLMFRRERLRMQKCLVMRNGGGYVYIMKNASVLKDSDGNVIGAVETITDITDLVEKETQIETFRRELQAEDRFYGILGASTPIQRVFDLITNAAGSDAPVIIYGESGTGKDLVAKAIHEISTRKNKPYVKVNCAALNESLLESELFGHVKGAYTGAHRNRKGRFEAAKGGDIFLDEIGDLPLSTQVKLLRVLEEKVIERVGDNRSFHIDVRIISATNQDLRQLVDLGAFREDFFYRINVIPIWLPPLRERTGDIPLLAEAFFRRTQLKSGKTIQGISNETLEILMKYPWPGNVRELKSAFEYAFVSCPGSMIAPEHLPPNIVNIETPPETKSESKLSLDAIKKQRLIDALRQSGGNQSEAARILGISRTSVWNQTKRFNIKL